MTQKNLDGLLGRELCETISIQPNGGLAPDGRARGLLKAMSRS